MGGSFLLGAWLLPAVVRSSCLAYLARQCPSLPPLPAAETTPDITSRRFSPPRLRCATRRRLHERASPRGRVVWWLFGHASTTGLTGGGEILVSPWCGVVWHGGVVGVGWRVGASCGRAAAWWRRWFITCQRPPPTTYTQESAAGRRASLSSASLPDCLIGEHQSDSPPARPPLAPGSPFTHTTPPAKERLARTGGPARCSSAMHPSCRPRTAPVWCCCRVERTGTGCGLGLGAWIGGRAWMAAPKGS